MADFASRPSCELVQGTGGCPSLEGGFVELLAFSEGRNPLWGGRSGKKQLLDHDHVYLEVENPSWCTRSERHGHSIWRERE